MKKLVRGKLVKCILAMVFIAFLAFTFVNCLCVSESGKILRAGRDGYLAEKQYHSIYRTAHEYTSNLLLYNNARYYDGYEFEVYNNGVIISTVRGISDFPSFDKKFPSIEYNGEVYYRHEIEFQGDYYDNRLVGIIYDYNLYNEKVAAYNREQAALAAQAGNVDAPVDAWDAEDGKINVVVYAVDQNPDYVRDAAYYVTNMGDGLYVVTAASILVCVLLFALLMRIAGAWTRDEEGKLVPAERKIEKIPFEIVAICYIAFAGIICGIIGEIVTDETIVALLAVGGFFIAAAGLWVCMDCAARIKRHVLVKGSICHKCLSLFYKILKKTWKWLVDLSRTLPFVWRTVAILAGVFFIEAFAASYRVTRHDFIVLVMWINIVLFGGIIYVAMMLRKLEDASEKLAEGDLNYKVDTKGLWWDFKKAAEKLNQVSVGMGQAVEQRMKSERMKTELITNVSHDIKTPLTSIINYANLISDEVGGNETDISENSEKDERIREYSDVLVRQSDRLKRLLEDLIEASKASSGVMDVDMVPVDATIFVSQAAGEYEEKMQAAGLSLVTKEPETEVKILADSRRMWRVFDNLMNNICKYAQSGTRVFLSLDVVDDKAVFIFRNTSRDALAENADELMERFVRGDKSRTAEGSGLGLSIAKSMVELQNGIMNIDVDGDLFKVTLQFPIVA